MRCEALPPAALPLEDDAGQDDLPVEGGAAAGGAIEGGAAGPGDPAPLMDAGWESDGEGLVEDEDDWLLDWEDLVGDGVGPERDVPEAPPIAPGGPPPDGGDPGDGPAGGGGGRGLGP